MIGYINLGTNNFEAATSFYDQLLAIVNADRVMTTERFVAWTTEPGMPMLSIVKPWDKHEASVGNGTMVALKVDTEQQVNAIYKKALELGGECEGVPGLRNQTIFIYDCINFQFK